MCAAPASSCLASLAISGLLLACRPGADPQSGSAPDPKAVARSAPYEAAERQEPHTPRLPAAPTAKSPPVLAPLPNELEAGVLSSLAIPGYRPARVLHGQTGTTRAMVYLHGVCGQIDKIQSFAKAASELVTTIAITGDRRCEDVPRFRWSQDLELIHLLIQRALTATKAARGGQLDTDAVVLFGYSQGSVRAEKLGARYPEHYPWLILGGLPRNPVLERLVNARAAAVLAGALEPSAAALRTSTAELTAAGVPVHFDLFPDAGHGQFGPQANAVMQRTLERLLRPSAP